MNSTYGLSGVLLKSALLAVLYSVMTSSSALLVELLTQGKCFLVTRVQLLDEGTKARLNPPAQAKSIHIALVARLCCRWGSVKTGSPVRRQAPHQS